MEINGQDVWVPADPAAVAAAFAARWPGMLIQDVSGEDAPAVYAPAALPSSDFLLYRDRAAAGAADADCFEGMVQVMSDNKSGSWLVVDGRPPADVLAVLAQFKE